MFEGEASHSHDMYEKGISHSFTRKGKEMDFAVGPYKHNPSLEKLILRNLEQDQVKPSSLSAEKWQKLLDLDPVLEWFKSETGTLWLNKFVGTEVGKAWFKARGERWLESGDGQAYLGNHLHKFVGTEVGKAWFKARGERWLESGDGQAYLGSHLHKFVGTEVGKAWFKARGERWFESYNGRTYLSNHAPEFLKTEAGDKWAERGGIKKYILQSLPRKERNERDIFQGMRKILEEHRSRKRHPNR